MKEIPEGAVLCPACEGARYINIVCYEYPGHYDSYHTYEGDFCSVCEAKGYLDWIERITKNPGREVSKTNRFFRCQHCGLILVVPSGQLMAVQIERCPACWGYFKEFKPRKSTLEKIKRLNPRHKFSQLL